MGEATVESVEAGCGISAGPDVDLMLMEGRCCVDCMCESEYCWQERVSPGHLKAPKRKKSGDRVLSMTSYIFCRLPVRTPYAPLLRVRAARSYDWSARPRQTPHPCLAVSWVSCLAGFLPRIPAASCTRVLGADRTRAGAAGSRG